MHSSKCWNTELRPCSPEGGQPTPAKTQPPGPSYSAAVKPKIAQGIRQVPEGVSPVSCKMQPLDFWLNYGASKDSSLALIKTMLRGGKRNRPVPPPGRDASGKCGKVHLPRSWSLRTRTLHKARTDISTDASSFCIHLSGQAPFGISGSTSAPRIEVRAMQGRCRQEDGEERSVPNPKA